jgi:hypothetical protein
MRLALALFLPVVLVIPTQAQMRDNRDKQLNCEGSNGNRVRTCEVRETTLGPSSSLEIEPSHNGGVMVKGWADNSILVRTRVEAWAENDAEARALASQIHVEAVGGRIGATGPEPDQARQNQNRGWAASFEVFAPWNTDLKAASHNGGITVSDLRGRIDVQSHNGGVRLSRVAGDLTAETHNGGMQVELEGNSWDGRQLSLSTHNGSVSLSMPASYSASFETSNNNGRLDSDYPITARGRLDGGKTNFTVGSGGPLIKVSTHNGGIRLKRN